MLLKDCIVSTTKNGNAQKDILGFLVLFSFSTTNGVINSLVAQIHKKQDGPGVMPGMLGEHLSTVTLNASTGKISINITEAADGVITDVDSLKTAITVELTELKDDLTTTN